jgi:hypothetical protein
MRAPKEVLHKLQVFMELLQGGFYRAVTNTPPLNQPTNPLRLQHRAWRRATYQASIGFPFALHRLLGFNPNWFLNTTSSEASHQINSLTQLVQIEVVEVLHKDFSRRARAALEELQFVTLSSLENCDSEFTRK